MAHEYLSLLFLAYITEAHCHLELEEIRTARCRLKEGAEVLRPRVEKYIRKLLISVPIGYSFPSWVMANGSSGGSILTSLIELSRLVQICRWLEPTLDWNEKNVLPEAQRKNLATFIHNPQSSSHYQYLVIPALGLGNTLPGVLGALGLGIGGLLGAVAGCGAGIIVSKAMENSHTEVNNVDPTPEEGSPDYLHPLETIEKIEEMIESYSRFEAYQAEIKSIQTLGMSFYEWLDLTPSTKIHQDEGELMYIIPSEPIDLAVS